MARRVSRRKRKLIATAQVFRSLIAEASVDDLGKFYEPQPHRTFAWYIVMLSNGLEEIVRPRRPILSASRAETLRDSARQIVAAIRLLFSDDQLAGNPELVAEVLREITPTRLAYQRLSYYLVTELKATLRSVLKAERTTLRSGNGALGRRRPPRKRSELPDPTLPAWAPVNRMPPKKVQIPCRIDPQLKALIEEEADKLGISQSRWLEEAIAERLQRQGHAVELPKPDKPRTKKPERARRVQRAKYPVPYKSPDAHDNRADYSTSTRMGPTLAAEIDRARGKQDRSTWLNTAITAFLNEKGELPEPSGAREVQSEPFAVRFDRDFFPLVEAAAKKSGLNRSEWYRRVARWYLDK